MIYNGPNPSFPSNTLSNILSNVMDSLGFVDPVAAFSTRTKALSDLRDMLASRLGWHKSTAGYTADVTLQLDNFLNQAQQQFFSRVELSSGASVEPTEMVADTDLTTLDYIPIFSLALAMAKAQYGQGDSKIYLVEYQNYLTDLDRRLPPNATSLVTRMIISAQKSLFTRYELFRSRRWYSWAMTQGTRFYGVTANVEITPDKMFPGKLEWVGINTNGQNWKPLICGIDPLLYTGLNEGVPQYYDVRGCIEVWPAASASSVYTLMALGEFGLLPFAATTDLSSVDPHAIYLKATMDAKAYYKQSDAEIYQGDLERYIGDLTAQTHMTSRYIPGYVAPQPYTPPKIAL